MSHSRSTVRVTRSLDTPLGIASAAPAAAGILPLYPVGCRSPIPLLNLPEFLECYFFGVYLAKRVLHASF